jgi:ribonuclease HII
MDEVAVLPDFTREAALIAGGCPHVCGIDEAGRGPLAGPVVAAAVILEPGCIPEGLNDSKKLTAAAREALFAALPFCARIGVGIASVEEIDRLNILRASHLAMMRAVAALVPQPLHCLVDGHMLPREMTLPATPVIGGDGLSLSIAAASVVAKVTRDRIMVDLAQQHPQYGWESNMGYAAPVHREALKCHGVTPHHRRSFRTVHNILYQAESLSL